MNIIVRNIKIDFRQDKEKAFEIALDKLKKVGIKGKNPYVYKRSIDSRHKDDIKFVYSVSVEAEGADEKKLQRIDATIEKESICEPTIGSKKLENRPVVCGFGPGGMFAGLYLAMHGYKPIVIERGDCVANRKIKVDRFMQTGVLDTNSNIQFGAGGAGTFSDGKLVTRISDPACRYVFEKLCEFGAPEEIMYDAKPHIGTDKLLGVVQNISDEIERLGGEIRYNTTLKAINKVGDKVVSLETTGGEIPCGALILAIGNSARDTYRYLIKEGYKTENKPFSVGVRIEHLREDIDRAMYGDFAGHELLGAAPYGFSKRVGERGVYTFCMCPGGEVIAAASEENTVVTNGMSKYLRNGVNSNAAICVSVNPENPIEYQEMLEQKAFLCGGGEYYAPCQRVGDFLDGVKGTLNSQVKPTYMGGKVRAYDLSTLFTSDIVEMLRLGISSFDRSLNGFANRDALLTGVETRTSAPIRITRDDNLCAVGTDNIYPCGEGAGYAGGITSAACDGLKCATALIEKYAQPNS